MDETDDDMRRLTADIDRVLTGRPDLRLVKAGAPSSDDPFGSEPAFEWQSAKGAAGAKPADPATGWLDRARRERRFERARTAMSYVVALGVAGLFIAVAAFLVVGFNGVAQLSSVVQGLGL